MRLYLPAIILLLTISNSSVLLAQKNFQRGYVVVEKEDTLHGLINRRSWAKNPITIEFKTTPEGGTSNYDMSQIVAFKVEDESYVKANVMTNVSSFNLNDLSSSPTPKMIPVTALLRKIVEGTKCLYSLETNDIRQQFYIYEDSKFEPLIFHKYTPGGDVSKIIEVETYKQQLQKYLGDCASLKINSLKYELTSLSSVVKKYYDCTGANPTFNPEPEKLSIKSGILAGFTRSKLEFRGSDIFYGPYITNFKPSYRPTVGGFLNLTFARTRKKLSLNNEALLTFLKSKENIEFLTSNGALQRSETMFSLNYLKFNNLVSYKVVDNKFNLFLSAGISNAFIIWQKNYLESTERNNGTRGKAINDTRKHEQGIVFGVATQVKKTSFNLRYEMTNGISPYSDLKSVIRRAYLLIAYEL